MKYILKNKEIELTEDEVSEIIKQNTKPPGGSTSNAALAQFPQCTGSSDTITYVSII